MYVVIKIRFDMISYVFCSGKKPKIKISYNFINIVNLTEEEFTDIVNKIT